MGCCSGCGPGEGESRELDVVPASPLVAQRGTAFADALEAGHIAVVRATYFKQCLKSGAPFQDRAKIPAEAFIDGKEAVDMWEAFGYAFLVVISYPWLSREHPDPQCFHLPRLVLALEIFRGYHERESWKGEQRDRALELGGGVILDYCSFWQGERSPEQDRAFKEGLSLINIPYGHRDVTALKLVSTPESEARRYDDRGWTHFESTVIDGKAPSARHNYGKRNVLTCGDAFDPKRQYTLTWLADSLRKPPLTPQRFREELRKRRERAEAKGERLFTNNKDSPVILERYDASFAELSRSTKLDCNNANWGAEEAKDLALALPSFQALQELCMARNRLEGEAAAALAVALPQCRALRTLELDGNHLGRSAEAFAGLAHALAACPALEELNLSSNYLEAKAAGALAETLTRFKALRKLGLEGNHLSETLEAFAGLTSTFAKCPALEELNLSLNHLRNEAVEVLAAALPQCRALRTLGLRNNDLRKSAKAATALADALRQCRTLRSLTLGANNLGENTEASGVMRAFAECSALEELDLSNNGLGVEAAAGLADALPRCHALRKLQLDFNHLGVGVEAAAALVRAFTECAGLEELNVYGNRLGTEAVGPLAAALAQHSALRRLDLRENNLDEGVQAGLRKAWHAAGKKDGFRF